MTINELINVVNGSSKLNSDEIIREIKTDSRIINKGDVFIAIKGKKYDGHNYVEEAIEKGALACIVENYINNDKCIKVDNIDGCLFNLSNHIRNIYNVPLIAITGSNGKTTTKELIVHILKNKYNVLYNEDSKNNIIGVSHTLFGLNKYHDIIVMELGSNHIGEISTLSRMCNPTTSIITNIGTAHLQYFKTKKNIFKEKLSVIDGMDTKNLIVNGDDRYLKKLNYYKSGFSKKNDLIAYNVCEDLNQVNFNIYLDKEYKINFNNPGRHFISDILLAIKVCLDYEIDINTIINSISSFKSVKRRMNLIDAKNNNIIIDDCYNASLESISCGLEYLKKFDKDKIFIIGDILELGKYSKRIHKKINKKLKYIDNKVIFTVGQYSKYIKGTHFNNVDDLIEYLKQINITKKIIYIKGSRRINLEKIINFLT